MRALFGGVVSTVGRVWSVCEAFGTRRLTALFCHCGHGCAQEIKHGSLKGKVMAKTQANQTQETSARIVNHPTSQHFGRECNHGDIHAQATNQGFSRKPNGGGFYSY